MMRKDPYEPFRMMRKVPFPVPNIGSKVCADVISRMQ